MYTYIYIYTYVYIYIINIKLQTETSVPRFVLHIQCVPTTCASPDPQGSPLFFCFNFLNLEKISVSIYVYKLNMVLNNRDDTIANRCMYEFGSVLPTSRLIIKALSYCKEKFTHGISWKQSSYTDTVTKILRFLFVCHTFISALCTLLDSC